ncbi:MAG: hypothetical protein ACRC2T_10810 [Thermoguttaceae bacterium]
MTPKEISIEIDRREISRRKLAEKIGCTYGYLNTMLNEFNPLKKKWADRIETALKEWKE